MLSARSATKDYIKAETNFILFPSYSFHKSWYHKSCFLTYLYSAGTQHENLHPAVWPILFCGPTQERKNRERVWKKCRWMDRKSRNKQGRNPWKLQSTLRWSGKKDHDLPRSTNMWIIIIRRDHVMIGEGDNTDKNGTGFVKKRKVCHSSVLTHKPYCFIFFRRSFSFQFIYLFIFFQMRNSTLGSFVLLDSAGCTKKKKKKHKKTWSWWEWTDIKYGKVFWWIFWQVLWGHDRNMGMLCKN